MKKINFRENERALAIVAHPDDETIWMGGFILKHKQLKWTIFSLCRASDKDRAPKFKRVCKRYGATGIITNLEDRNIMSVKESLPKIKRLIQREVKDKKFDYIFTHGRNGEYGHKRHKGVNRAVVDMVDRGQLACGRLLCFNYEKAKKGKRPSMKASSDSDYLLKLSPAMFKEKKRIQSEIYGYPWYGIDVGFCTNPEAFVVIYNKQ